MPSGRIRGTHLIPAQKQALTRTTQDSNQLTRATSVITDGDDIAERTALRFSESIEDINKAVSSTAAGEDDDTAGLRRAVRRSHFGGRCSCVFATNVWRSILYGLGSAYAVFPGSYEGKMTLVSGRKRLSHSSLCTTSLDEQAGLASPVKNSMWCLCLRIDEINPSLNKLKTMLTP